MFNLKYYWNGGYNVEDKGWFNSMNEVMNEVEKDGWFDGCVDWEEEGYEVYDKNGNYVDC